ncbi:MAG: hypothetical protein ACYC7A_11790 [Thermoanaerobaculia bacterium]
MENSAFQGYLQRGQANVLASSLLRRQKGTRISTIGLVVGVVSLALGILEIVKSNSSGATQWIILGVLVGLVAGALRVSEWRATVRSLLAQEMKGSVEAEGVRLVSAQSETLFRWSSFQQSEEGRSVIILWLAQGQVIPLAEQMFVSPGAFNSVVSFIRAQIRAT